MNTQEGTLPQNSRQRRHFHTFDAMRFFACFKVFLQHLPIFAFPWFSLVKVGGGIGVQFFFVLSGFLITYIICDEKQRVGRLNLRDFFTRRVLRIWPLFYFMIGVAFITPYILGHFLHLSSSTAGYTPTWWVSLLFLENYKMMFSGLDPNVSPLGVMWSLCIEEHFYIVWGLLLYFTDIKLLPRIIIACLGIAIISRGIYAHYDIATSDLFSNIDLFAFGAIPAYLLVTKPVETEAYINRIPLPAKRAFVVLLLLVVILCGQVKGYGQYMLITTVLGAFFCGLIFLTLPAHTRFRIKDSSLLSKLGLYTYGFYLYHTLVINLFRRVFEKKGWVLDTGKWAIIYFAITFVVSIACSIASYHLFEKYFLRLKKYFRGNLQKG